MEAVLGIDFGTAKICCAVWMPETGVRLLKTDRSETMVPTYVVKDGERTILGTEGRDLSLINTFSSVFDLSMYLGWSVTKANSLAMLFGAPFSFQGNEDAPAAMNIVFSNPALPVETEPVTRVLFELLHEVKAQAEAVTGCKIKHCAVAVRSINVQPQLAIPLDALGLTGTFVCDHDAALNGYLLQIGAEKELISAYVVVDVGASGSRIIVYKKQLGRESFLPVSIVESHIGVRWLDLHVRQHCADQFEKAHGVGCQTDVQAVHRLRLECENARKKLSLARTFDFNLEQLYQQKTFKYRLTLAAFDEAIGPSVMELCQLVTTTLAGNGIDKNSSHCKLLLVGGGSRIPLVKRSVRWASGKIFYESVGGSADEVVAMGAAKLAHEHVGRSPASVKECPEIDADLQSPVGSHTEGQPNESGDSPSMNDLAAAVEDSHEAPRDVAESSNANPATGAVKDSVSELAESSENSTAMADGGSSPSCVKKGSLSSECEQSATGCAHSNSTVVSTNSECLSHQLSLPRSSEGECETLKEEPPVDRSRHLYSTDDEKRQIFNNEKKVPMKDYTSAPSPTRLYPDLPIFEASSATFKLTSLTTVRSPGRLVKHQNQVCDQGTHSSINSLDA